MWFCICATNRSPCWTGRRAKGCSAEWRTRTGRRGPSMAVCQGGNGWGSKLPDMRSRYLSPFVAHDNQDLAGTSDRSEPQQCAPHKWRLPRSAANRANAAASRAARACTGGARGQSCSCCTTAEGRTSPRKYRLRSSSVYGSPAKKAGRVIRRGEPRSSQLWQHCPRRVSTAPRELVERLHVGVQGTRSDSAVPGDGQTRRLS